MRKYNLKRNGLSSSTLGDIGIRGTNEFFIAKNFNLKSQIKVASRCVFENTGM